MRRADVHSVARVVSSKNWVWAEEGVPDCRPFSSLRRFDVCTFPRRCPSSAVFVSQRETARRNMRSESDEKRWILGGALFQASSHANVTSPPATTSGARSLRRETNNVSVLSSKSHPGRPFSVSRDVCPCLDF